MKNDIIVELVEDTTIGETVLKAGTKIKINEGHLDDIEEEFVYEVSEALRSRGANYAAEEVIGLIRSLVYENSPDMDMLPFMNNLTKGISQLTGFVARNS